MFEYGEKGRQILRINYQVRTPAALTYEYCIVLFAAKYLQKEACRSKGLIENFFIRLFHVV